MNTTNFHDSSPGQAGSREAIETDQGARLPRSVTSPQGWRRSLCGPVFKARSTKSRGRWPMRQEVDRPVARFKLLLPTIGITSKKLMR
ncbi:Unknown protein sequence [Pseudomonas amygdali pv. myricae]|nr:Unknown protein sequence [Pseudomonas amygdali pv. myricae]